MTETNGADGTIHWLLDGDPAIRTPKWTSTTYTMLLLRDLGLPPANRRARKACMGVTGCTGLSLL